MKGGGGGGDDDDDEDDDNDEDDDDSDGGGTIGFKRQSWNRLMQHEARLHWLRLPLTAHLEQ